MLKNYLKIAFRQLWKHKLFSIFNVFGLATSMSVCLLLIMVLVDQYTHDAFHEKGNRIYRVITGSAEKNVPLKKPNWATAPLSLADRLKQEYPFVESAVRVIQIGANFQIGEKVFEDGGHGFAVDNDFLKVFDFGWVAGDQRTALVNPRSVVLSEKFAQKFFPNADPLGQRVLLSDLGEFTITGIIPDLQQRSHIKFDYLLSFSTVLAFSEKDLTKVNLHGFDEVNRGFVYLVVDEKTDRKTLESALATQASLFSQKHPHDHFLLQAQPLGDIMPSRDLSNDITDSPPRVVLYFLLSLGLMIMLAALINYMSLSVARSLKRAKEIGIRKVTGAGKRDIILQFMGEAILIALLALVAALLILEYLIPAFYALDPLVEKSFQLDRTPTVYLIFFIFSLIVGLMAGIFPAFNISAFQPIDAMKQLSNVRLFSRVGLRKVLITVQFALSLVFILSVNIVLKQQQYILNTDLGVKIDDVLNVYLEDVDYEVFAQQVGQLKGVEAVSGSSYALLAGQRSGSKAVLSGQEDTLFLFSIAGSPNYIDNMGIELIAGNNSASQVQASGGQFLLLNEVAVERLGFSNPDEAIGQSIDLDSLQLTVSGVVRNFHHNNIWFDPIEPFAIQLGSDFSYCANIRLDKTDQTTTIAAIESIWDKLSPEKPMTAFFLDERVYYMSKFFRMGSHIIGFVGFLTIVISCMGLLGMVIYSMEGKIKEVGIRKILGADTGNLLWLLSKGFLLLMVLAMLIAVPVTIAGANFWLQNFVLRIHIGAATLLSGIGILFLLGLLMVVSQTYWAARNNPVQALRNE